MPEQRLTDVVRDLYVYLDKEAKKRADAANVSCKTGCNFCCMLMATAGIVEGVYIAEHLLLQPNWKDWLPKLRAASQGYCYKDVNKANYFSKKIQCVFLKDGLCSVYEKRPEACRYHYVVSPAANCDPDSEDKSTGILNLIPLSQRVWMLNSDFVKELVQTNRTAFNLLVGPIPLMVLNGMAILASDKADLALVLEALEGLPSPMEWVVNYTSSSEKEPSEEESALYKETEP